MYFEPTYTTKQFCLTILTSGLILGLILSGAYLVFYNYLYITYSFLFSIIYLIPLLGLSITLIVFRYRYVWNNFSYGSAFSLSFLTGLTASVIFALILFLSYSYFGLESRLPLYENLFDGEIVNNECVASDDKKDMLASLLSPVSTSLSMFVVNVILSLVYSLIIAIFAQQKKTE